MGEPTHLKKKNVHVSLIGFHFPKYLDLLQDASNKLRIFFQMVVSSGQISIIPKPELRGFLGSSLIKPPFRVTSADVVIICPGHKKVTE